jgi:hypothetical protein
VGPPSLRLRLDAAYNTGEEHATEPNGTRFAHSLAEEPFMRLLPAFVSFLVLWVPTLAHSQSVVVHGSAGATLVDRGYSLAGGAGWAPWSRVTLSLNLERTHLFSRVRSDGRGGTSGFRGGTLTLGAAELRVALFPRHRVTPYVLAGYAAGVSRPNVNPTFPERVTNDVRAVFGGAGVQVPLRPRISLFADARMMLGSEANELLAVAPVRAGVRVQVATPQTRRRWHRL